MAFCPHCGSSISAGTAFCANCGAPQNAAPAAAPTPGYARPAAPAPAGFAPRAGQLHCPSCKGVHLTPVVESSVNGAITSTRGSMSSTRVSNTHRNYWMCSSCGNKFRNIQNLEEEIVATEKSVKVSIVMTVISALLFLLLITKGESFMLFLFLPFVVTVGLVALVSFCMIFSYKGKANKMKEELAYLQYHCFN